MYLEWYFRFNLVREQKAARQNKLNVRHFGSHSKGLAAKHDVTVQQKHEITTNSTEHIKTLKWENLHMHNYVTTWRLAFLIGSKRKKLCSKWRTLMSEKWPQFLAIFANCRLWSENSLFLSVFSNLRYFYDF